MITIEIKCPEEVYEQIKTFANSYGLSVGGTIINAFRYYKLLKEETRKCNIVVIENSKGRKRKRLIIE